GELRRGCRADLSRALAGDRPDRAGHAGRGAAGEALLPARPRREGREDQREAGQLSSASGGTPAAPDLRRRRNRALAELPVLAVAALAVALVLKTFVAQAFYIPSGSMEPQLQIGDRVVVSKVAYDLHDPRRGETVQGHDGHVYVDGRRLVEPYLPATVVTEDFGPVTVPAGHVWVMGDNRLNSEDSTRFGPVPEGDLIGRAIAKIWPPGGAEFLCRFTVSGMST